MPNVSGDEAPFSVSVFWVFLFHTWLWQIWVLGKYTLERVFRGEREEGGGASTLPLLLLAVFALLSKFLHYNHDFV